VRWSLVTILEAFFLNPSFLPLLPPSSIPPHLSPTLFRIENDHGDHGDGYGDEDGYDAINAINANDEAFGKGSKAKTKCGGHLRRY